MAYPQLGDVTTPGTGSGPGYLSQIWGWLTASSANAANSPQIVQDWMAQVRARGNAVVRYPFPSDDVSQTGDLVERMDAGDAGYNYLPAPTDVVNADRALRNLSVLAPATAKIAAVGESLTSGVSSEVKKVAIYAGVALVAIQFIPSLIGRRR